MKGKVKTLYAIRQQVSHMKDDSIAMKLWATLRKHEQLHGLSLSPVGYIHPKVRDAIMSTKESINAYVSNTFPNPTRMPNFGERLRARERS